VRDDGRSVAHLLEHRCDVDAFVLRRVGSEPPLRLLELPLAPDPVATPRLVPGDGDVDEPLVEVPLRRRRGAPGRLELLVRGEELAAPNQLEPLIEVRP
jgi:hypothetical protein